MGISAVYIAYDSLMHEPPFGVARKNIQYIFGVT